MFEGNLRVQSCPIDTKHGGVPALLDGHGLALHVGSIAGELLKILANIVEMLEPLIEGDRVVRR